MSGILNGCLVTPSSPADMQVHVSAGEALFGQSVVAVAAGALTVTTADATNPRIDAVKVASNGTKSVVAGSPAATPVPPSVGSDQYLAFVFVPAAATAITDHYVGDRRTIVQPQTDARLIPQAHPTPLTDSTGGTPAATLVVVRSDTAAHTAADAIANDSSLNARIDALQTALVAAGVLT